MVTSVRQNCPKCGRPFMGSDCKGDPCPRCQRQDSVPSLHMVLAGKLNKLRVAVLAAHPAGSEEGADPFDVLDIIKQETTVELQRGPEPVIYFSDDDGNIGTLVWEEGDESVGIYPGYVLGEYAKLYVVQSESELRFKRMEFEGEQHAKVCVERDDLKAAVQRLEGERVHDAKAMMIQLDGVSGINDRAAECQRRATKVEAKTRLLINALSQARRGWHAKCKEYRAALDDLHNEKQKSRALIRQIVNLKKE